MDSMSKEVAQIPDLLHEKRLPRIRIAIDPEQQGMSAKNAHILVMAGAHGNPDIPMPQEKARDRMRDSRFLAVSEITHTAFALLLDATHHAEDRVAHLVTKQQARDLTPHSSNPVVRIAPQCDLGCDRR
jgi:hypothetical protein